MLRSLIAILILASPAYVADPPAPPPKPVKIPTPGGPVDGLIVLGPTLAPPTIPPTPPDATAGLSVAPGRFVPLTTADGSPSYFAASPAYRLYKIAPGGQYTGTKFDAADGAEPESYSWPDQKGPVYCLLARNVPGTYSVQAVRNGKPEDGPENNGQPVVITVTGARPPPVPPTPPVPPLPPEPPTPQPVTSFRVIFVHESGATLPAAQQSVMGAKSVRDYLNAKCTPEGGLPGWRQRDKDTDGSKDQPTMAALWAAVKPKLTAIPCIVVELNGKAEILPFPTNAADALTLLKKYGG